MNQKCKFLLIINSDPKVYLSFMDGNLRKEKTISLYIIFFIRNTLHMHHDLRMLKDCLPKLGSI